MPANAKLGSALSHLKNRHICHLQFSLHYYLREGNATGPVALSDQKNKDLNYVVFVQTLQKIINIFVPSLAQGNAIDHLKSQMSYGGPIAFSTVHGLLGRLFQEQLVKLVALELP